MNVARVRYGLIAAATGLALVAVMPTTTQSLSLWAEITGSFLAIRRARSSDRPEYVRF